VFTRADPRCPLFVAEEIGIVPIRSMLTWLYATGFGRPATLAYWARDPDWLVYDAEFRSLVRRYPGFAYHPAVASTSDGPSDGASGHDVTLVVPASSRVRAAWRNFRSGRPEWVPDFRARIRWVPRWTPEALPEGDVVVATAWQSAPSVAAAPSSCGAKFYLVQHYESLYHGAPDAVDTTYRLPLKKVVISTWLRDLMRQRFGSPAEVLVTPVDLDLFHPTPADVSTSRPRVLMLHHEHAWKGVADGFEAV